MHPRSISIFFLALLFFTPISSAVAYSTPLGDEIDSSAEMPALAPAVVEYIPSSTNPLSEDLFITFQSLPSGGSVCRLSSLSPVEVQRFKDNILTPGIIGKEIGLNPYYKHYKVIL
jgi:predicted PurR-regulated permease PerM